MAKMNQRVKEIFEKQETIVLATATKDGLPNVVPVNAKKIIDDETILISDQFFNKTLKNLQANPQVAITVWDKLEGYQIKGTVTVKTSGPEYEKIKAQIKEKGAHYPAKGLLILSIREVFECTPGQNAGKKIE